ncbi:hypothetical protein AK830_g9592 [Neonectria ditissima]|uniref:Uncharacterized protein n=1 Tax=Neonectria ditissima TaxID=78410 RepID=A0A0P7ARQ7_9HYPO|nr:hypothetical protein AK830_g9592 [Neonectria ditissima]
MPAIANTNLLPRNPFEASAVDSVYKTWAISSTTVVAVLTIMLISFSVVASRRELRAIDNQVASFRRIQDLADALQAVQQRNLDLEKGHLNDELARGTSSLSHAAARFTGILSEILISQDNKPPHCPHEHVCLGRVEEPEAKPYESPASPAYNLTGLDRKTGREIQEEDLASPIGFHEIREDYREASRRVRERHERERIHGFKSSPSTPELARAVVWPFHGGGDNHTLSTVSSPLLSPPLIYTRATRSLC